jgi:hypothetical protein
VGSPATKEHHGARVPGGLREGAQHEPLAQAPVWVLVANPPEKGWNCVGADCADSGFGLFAGTVIAAGDVQPFGQEAPLVARLCVRREECNHRGTCDQAGEHDEECLALSHAEFIPCGEERWNPELGRKRRSPRARPTW